MIPLYPWPTFREPWQLDLREPTFDGVARSDVLMPDHRRLRSDLVADWAICALEAVATAPSAGGAPRPDAAHLLVSAPRAQTRLPLPLSPDGAGSWRARVELPQDLLAGIATVTAELTAVLDGRVRFLGRSEPWSVVVDPSDAPVPVGAPPFPMVWVDFGDPGAPELARRSPGAPAVMDLSGSPTLYLNDAMPGLHRLLHADTARGERRRARDLMGAEVARITLTALVRAAAADLEADDDGVVTPADQLLRQTLEGVAGVMRSTSGIDELCRRIVEADTGPAIARANLWSEIDGAVARLAGLPDFQASLSEEARNA
ncbi:hypothetical protein [Actinotalea sp. Marseille-Q4924]|uniref:hypothetical protein n=1 Tax=Actinotalea sp. Marseille-Q4924 TaxID=2866571 RepID=UPI001CE49305|nr:hypothetical protein [Actinotalea sp. Marseille-Q4924]